MEHPDLIIKTASNARRAFGAHLRECDLCAATFESNRYGNVIPTLKPCTTGERLLEIYAHLTSAELAEAKIEGN